MRYFYVLPLLISLVTTSWAGMPIDVLPTAVSTDTMKAVNSLLKIKQFSFGGTGDAGKISPGELAFRKVCKSPQAITCFWAMLGSGTSESDLYALCGYYRISKSDFMRVAELPWFKNRQASVVVMSGCIMSTEKFSDVLNQIKTGKFDQYLLKK